MGCKNEAHYKKKKERFMAIFSVDEKEIQIIDIPLMDQLV
jgi:hypothetical protein